MITHFTIENFLSEKQCDEILKYSIENLKIAPAVVEGGQVIEKVRKSKISFVNYDKLFPYIKELLINEISKNMVVKGYEINFENQPFQFTTYEKGEYYNWHQDVLHRGQGSDRYCSVVIQLNNEYNGGNLEMKKLDDEDVIIQFKRGKGNLFVFLSHIWHRVTEIEDGNRYSLVSWFNLKPTQNYKKTLI